MSFSVSIIKLKDSILHSIMDPILKFAFFMKSARFHALNPVHFMKSTLSAWNLPDFMKSALSAWNLPDFMKSTLSTWNQADFMSNTKWAKEQWYYFWFCFWIFNFNFFWKLNVCVQIICILLGQSLLWWFQSLRIICPWPGSSNCPFQNAYLYDCIVCFCHKFCQPSTVKVWWCISSKLHIRHLFYRPEILLQLYCWQLVFKNCLRYVLDLPSMLVQGGRSL